MMKKLTLILLALLFMPVQSFAQVVIKDCGGGVTVGGNDTCPRRQRPVETYLVPRWGAIAVDTAPDARKKGFGVSPVGQINASKRALELCGLKTCKLVAEYKNACGAVAATAGDIWVMGVGIDIWEDKAEQKALANCEQNRRGKNLGPCTIWMRASTTCAGAPR